MGDLETSVQALSFQYFSGANMSIAGAGIAKSTGKWSLFGLGGAGYDTSAGKPLAAALFNAEYAYNDNLSGCFTALGVFNDNTSTKYAITPCKLRVKLSKNCGAYLQPRAALVQSGKKLSIKPEAIAGTSIKISDRISGNLEVQCYDLGKPNKDNLSLNAGLSYNF